jgi:SnoaL-like domain
MLDVSWADGGVYQDPSGIADGRAALVKFIGGFHEMYPGHTIEFASGVDITDAGLRWAWVMRRGDEIVLDGMDFAELAPDGRIQRIAVFFGQLPPLDDTSPPTAGSSQGPRA